MAKITINIPDGKVDEILDAFTSQYSELKGKTKAQKSAFMKRKFVEHGRDFIKGIVKTHRIKIQEEKLKNINNQKDLDDIVT